MASHFITKAKLKSGELRYRAVITESGRNIKSKTFRRRTDAKAWSIRFILEREELEATGQKTCNVTFSELCHEYINAWTGRDHDRVRMVLVWETTFRDRLLSDITQEIIRKHLKPKKQQAPSTYNKHRNLLIALFKFAIEQHNDDENPRNYVGRNPASDIPALPADNKRVRYLSDQEKPKLLKACKAIGGKFYLCVLMALTTGMRKGELMSLRWSDIDFDRGLAMLELTKNGSRRHTPIPDIILDKLREVRGIGKGLVFPAPHDSTVPITYTRQWHAVLKASGIQDFRWHDMRHDVASTLARDGKTLKEIAEILGHKSLASTDRYTHLCTEHKCRVLNDTMSKTITL